MSDGREPRAIRSPGAYTLVEVLIAAALATVLLVLLFAAFGWASRAGTRMSADASASLELTELLEYLCQDVREADDLVFEEQRGVTSMTLSRAARGTEAAGTTRSYEVSDGGRRVLRSDGGKRRRAYNLGQGGGEGDRLLIELSADRRMLLLRALGLTLELPTPLARGRDSSAADAPGGPPPAGTGSAAAGVAPAASGPGGTRFVFGLRQTPAVSASAVPLEETEPSATPAPGGEETPPDSDENLSTGVRGTGVDMEGDAHELAVTYRFLGGGDEAPVMGTDSGSGRFGLYETRSNLRDPSSGEPLLFFRGDKPGRDPSEPIYVLPDPFRRRTLSGGTPSDGWPGVDDGPGLAESGARSTGPDRSTGSPAPDGPPPSLAASPARPPAGPPTGDGKAADPLTLDRAVADAITGNTSARDAILETIRELRGLPPGTADQLVQDVAANLDRARQELADQAASGTGPSADGSFGPLERATSINRQIIRSQIVKEQGLNETGEADAARAVEERLRNPGAPPPPLTAGDAPPEAPPETPAAPPPPPPPPIEVDGK